MLKAASVRFALTHHALDNIASSMATFCDYDDAVLGHRVLVWAAELSNELCASGRPRTLFHSRLPRLLVRKPLLFIFADMRAPRLP